MTPVAPAASPAYLRHLAARFATSSTPGHRATAERLHAIAGELDELLAMSQGATPATRPPASPTGGSAIDHDRIASTDARIAEIRKAAHKAPTPEEMAEIRALVASSGQRQT